MPEYVHGGDVYSYTARFGSVPVDLSANINPYGIPERVRQAMRDAIEACTQYPDPFCRAPRQAIAEAEGVAPDRIYCGSGAADVLDRLAAVLRPKTALLLAPTFAEYERTLAGAELRFHTLRADEDFAVTERILQDITPDLDAVYLCNPNNPTGRTIDPALLRDIAVRCAQIGARLIVDECFLDFVPGGETLAPYLDEFPSLVLLRAYTKMYAVPGVRFGWCMTADTALIEGLYRAGQPWNVSVVAQACAVACAGERDYARQTAARIAAERAYLTESLTARGLWVCPGEANFLLLRARDTDLQDKLARRGILIRDCANYRGLARGYYRTAVKTREESKSLLAALDDIRKEET
ncbi:pyridoxal phosphate-dependent aminotransferase [Agathobaculum sp. Marseille-P7918]|uniref:pyridoxal phosphate-dependent aminotransferase n=1 Tax=Agathobaculum sp. Marseille-P7918 TaxID=2479843 RepID=UPI000F6408F9|nr:aminotransferase class I/II-fold pyridoxal phosphate-dependent enzyme [Agathobaculum sp. Marseille-P7918]